MEHTCKEILVVAIDFGTTFSGYAYSFRSEYLNDPGKILCNTNWSSGTNYTLKTPTAILIKLNNTMRKPEYQEFGYKAQDRYTELIENDEHFDYFLLERFKMKLYSKSAVSGLHRDTMIPIGRNFEIRAIEAISKFIKYLKDHFMEAMSKRNLKLKEGDIRWVLTVPAIWTDGAKQFMKISAEEAGISSSKLTIAYEPEAAALCCIHLQDPTKNDKRPILETGTKCIVVDAGGGTVDYTVNEVTDRKDICVKHAASGGPWGGTTVDDGFVTLLMNLLGDAVYGKIIEEHREDFVTLCREFEHKKRNVPNDKKYLTFKLPATIAEIYKEIKGKEFTSPSDGKYSGNVQIIKDKLRIGSNIIREFFKTPCKNIVQHTKELLMKEEGKGTTTLLLVGGFMGSDILQREMRENFRHLNLIVPEDPELAVVKGAVLFGHNPYVVKTRVAKYTYGIRTAIPFNKNVHPQNKKVTYDGLDKCDDIFTIHVRKGQTLKVGNKDAKKVYIPNSCMQTEMLFKIYVSTEDDPEFVTDPSCTFIGSLQIDIPDTTRGLDREVTAQMAFGETEITVEATDAETGEHVSANFNFLG